MTAGAPASERWSDAFMDSMRQRGDELADAAVAEVFADGLPAVQRLMQTLVKNDAPAPHELPPAVARFFDAAPSAPDLPRVKQGEAIFAEHGPEVVTILLFYSLPSSYGCRRGVKVLHETAYLAKRPIRRIVETAQMIIDVMSPDGLGPGGRGIRSAQKVRLMHAAIRHLILQDRRRAWDTADLGIPINQEDLAGTLMTFSSIVVDGLRKLGCDLTANDEEAYLDAWRAVGRVMGVVPELLPANASEARELVAIIERRQTEPSPEGRAMAAALLDEVELNLPFLFKGFAPALMRHFLPPKVADDLGVPEHHLHDRIVAAAAAAAGDLDRIEDAFHRRRAVLRTFSLHMFQWLIDADRGGKRTRFQIPHSLQAHWSRPPGGHEPTIWARVIQRIMPHWL